MVSLSERIERLRFAAHAALREPVQAEFLILYCDRCGRRVDPRTAPQAELARWGRGPDGDLCPGCVRLAPRP